MADDPTTEPITPVSDPVGTARRQHGTAGAVLAAGMFGVDIALGRPPKEEIPVVVAAPTDPTDIDTDGRWQVVLDQPGRWHVVFESTPSGSSSSVVVAANFDDEQVVEPTPLPAPDDEVEVHGLRVTRTGLTFSVVNTDGSQSLDLEPYLGQPAHLVAIRERDLAYVHLHPQMDMVGGFMFGTDLPQAGTYRLFLQFGHAGEVLTVPFTVVQS